MKGKTLPYSTCMLPRQYTPTLMSGLIKQELLASAFYDSINILVSVTLFLAKPN